MRVRLLQPNGPKVFPTYIGSLPIEVPGMFCIGQSTLVSSFTATVNTVDVVWGEWGKDGPLVKLYREKPPFPLDEFGKCNLPNGGRVTEFLLIDSVDQLLITMTTYMASLLQEPLESGSSYLFSSSLKKHALSGNMFFAWNAKKLEILDKSSQGKELQDESENL